MGTSSGPISYTKTTQSTRTVQSESTVETVLDTSISQSAYGSVIPLVYGTILLSTNVIWTTGIREVTKTVTTTVITTTTKEIWPIGLG